MLSVRIRAACRAAARPADGRAADGRHAFVDRAVRVAAVDAVLDRRPRGQEDVVLIGAQQIGPFSAQHADHREGHVPHANFLADRVARAEQLADHRLADQADLAAADVPRVR